jgi:hypothetical protein
MAMPNEPEMTRQRFEELAESYGADIGRWPPGLQAPARLVMSRDPAAARLLAHAHAFDRLLDLAPAAAPHSAVLVDRIVTAALRDVASREPANGNVVALTQVRVSRASAARPPSAQPSAHGIPTARGWRLASGQAAGAGGMLAASLLIGVWLGASGTAAPSLGAAFATRPGVTADLDAFSEIVNSALSAELLEGHDEDSP